MPVEFKLPDLGENITSAGVLSVLVKEGDTIAPETPVLEIETDKATIEVPSSVGGKITKIHIKAGDKADVGQLLFTLEDSVAATQAEAPKPEAAREESPKPAEAASASAAKSGPFEVALPDLGENIDSANLLSILVKVGDEVTPETSIIELETDKATLEVPAGVTGKVTEIRAKVGTKVKVGEILLVVAGQASSSQAPLQSKPSVEETKASAPVAAPTPAVQRSVNGASKAHTALPAGPGKRAAASPTVRRLAREIGIDIAHVPGSGPRGRISHDDVKAFSRQLLKGKSSSSGGSAGFSFNVPELPDFARFGAVEREAMSGIRKKTAQQMGLAWSTIPMVTQFDKADMTSFDELRKRLDGKFKVKGAKLTVTALLLKILASALKVFPKFNASIDLRKEEVVFKHYFNLGVAVDTERGLLVPVLKNVDKKNILEIALEMNTLAEKARNRKVSPDDLQGASMTVTNLGGIGGTSFTPIVNPPEVAILGVSRAAIEPVWDGGPLEGRRGEEFGKFVPQSRLPLSLSYDHRLIDGAEAARFLRWVCEALETPAMLVFEG